LFLLEFVSCGCKATCCLLLVTCCLLLVTCCLLLVTCYLLLVTCYLLLVTCYLLLVTCCLLLVVCYLLLVTCYLLLVTCYLLFVTCYLLRLLRANSRPCEKEPFLDAAFSRCSLLLTAASTETGASRACFVANIYVWFIGIGGPKTADFQPFPNVASAV